MPPLYRLMDSLSERRHYYPESSIFLTTRVFGVQREKGAKLIAGSLCLHRSLSLSLSLSTCLSFLHLSLSTQRVIDLKELCFLLVDDWQDCRYYEYRPRHLDSGTDAQGVPQSRPGSRFRDHLSMAIS